MHRLATSLVERRDAVLLDLLLAREAELLLDLELDGEPVAVPAALARDVAPAHRVEARIEVLEHPRPDVMDARTTVRRRGALVEDPLRRAFASAQALGEDIVVAPARQHAFFERNQVELAVDRAERHRIERIVRGCAIDGE